jgi:hypothetical protein
VEQLSDNTDVVIARNYGEAGALELFGRDLPPIASGHVSFQYWRPDVAGRRALLIGFERATASFCAGYRVVGHIAMPIDNEERGREIARCVLRTPLARAWPQIVSLSR